MWMELTEGHAEVQSEAKKLKKEEVESKDREIEQPRDLLTMGYI
jgi:hypothetical protein